MASGQLLVCSKQCQEWTGRGLLCAVIRGDNRMASRIFLMQCGLRYNIPPNKP